MLLGSVGKCSPKLHRLANRYHRYLIRSYSAVLSHQNPNLLSRANECEHFHKKFSSGSVGSWMIDPSRRYGRRLRAIIHILVVAVDYRRCSSSSDRQGDSPLESLWKAFVHFCLTGIQRRRISQAVNSHLLNICHNLRTL